MAVHPIFIDIKKSLTFNEAKNRPSLGAGSIDFRIENWFSLNEF